MVDGSVAAIEKKEKEESEREMGREVQDGEGVDVDRMA